MSLSKKIFFTLWLLLVSTLFSLFLLDRSLLESLLRSFLQTSTATAYVTLFILGILRGFTLIPVTFLIIIGIFFIPPLPLYLIIMSGVLISSLIVFYFFEYLNLETLFNEKHKKHIDRGAALLTKYELPVITLWSMAPFLPTDVMCYLAGTLRVNVYTFILGILIGEGAVCALYVWGGEIVLHSKFVF